MLVKIPFVQLPEDQRLLGCYLVSIPTLFQCWSSLILLLQFLLQRIFLKQHFLHSADAHDLPYKIQQNPVRQLPVESCAAKPDTSA